jgi:hypothetical protein
LANRSIVSFSFHANVRAGSPGFETTAGAPPRRPGARSESRSSVLGRDFPLIAAAIVGVVVILGLMGVLGLFA